MAILLLRVDERLIHGQVVVGWGNELHPDRIIIVDDELAASEWEQELYTLGLPDEIDASFVTVAEAIEQLPVWSEDDARRLLLTRDIQTMLRLAGERRLQGREVNIGGLHYAPGRESVLPYVHLDAAERKALGDLVEEGVVPSARDLPGSRRVGADRLLRGGSNR